MKPLPDEADDEAGPLREPVKPSELFHNYPCEFEPAPLPDEPFQAWLKRAQKTTGDHIGKHDSVLAFLVGALEDADDRTRCVQRLQTGLDEIRKVRDVVDDGRASIDLRELKVWDERGGVWVHDEGDHQIWVQLDGDLRLDISVFPGNYPALHVELVRRTDAELVEILRKGAFGGWKIEKLNLEGADDLVIDDRLRDFDDEDQP